MTINTNVLKIVRRTTNGFTVGEIFDRLQNQTFNTNSNYTVPLYSSVRAQVYRLADAGLLSKKGTRKDRVSGRTSATFVCA